MKKSFDGTQYSAWIRQANRGDERAWGKLVSEFQSLVYSIARRARLSDADCDDVFQSTFLALYRNLDKIVDAQTLPKWLAVTASRESYRLSKLAERTSSQESLEDVLAAEDVAVDTQAEDAIETETLHRSLSELGGPCEPLLRMLYFEEEPYNVIAQKIGIAIGSIGPTRARCLEKLRKIFAKISG
ncbi:MAG: sigma-70 family RNA polymerase sigma factor [Fimbriimonadaceae bacterium]